MSDNRFIEIANIDLLMKYWSFFVEGLTELNASCGKGHTVVTEEAFFKTLLVVIGKNPGFGLIGVLESKYGKPLAFGVIFDNTDAFCKRSAIIYAAYSTGRCPTATRELYDRAERWAQDHAFEELHAVSRRINGAAQRWFERKWGFRRAALIFTKPL